MFSGLSGLLGGIRRSGPWSGQRRGLQRTRLMWVRPEFHHHLLLQVSLTLTRDSIQWGWHRASCSWLASTLSRPRSGSALTGEISRSRETSGEQVWQLICWDDITELQHVAGAPQLRLCKCRPAVLQRSCIIARQVTNYPITHPR